MKIIIYSANIADYDYFYHPKNRNVDIDYYLFTNNKYFKSKYWNVISTSTLILNKIDKIDNRRLARFIKINSHKVLPDHDISIWLDHCFKFKTDNIQQMLELIQFNNKNIMCYSHDERNCIYQEAKVCSARKMDTNKIIQLQMQKYKTELFPPNFGLFSTGLMIRKNNEQVNNFNDVWWQEIYNGSGRDQLSQSYASWKNQLKIDPISVGKNIYNNSFLTIKNSHIKNK